MIRLGLAECHCLDVFIVSELQCVDHVIGRWMGTRKPPKTDSRAIADLCGRGKIQQSPPLQLRCTHPVVGMDRCHQQGFAYDGFLTTHRKVKSPGQLRQNFSTVRLDLAGLQQAIAVVVGTFECGHGQADQHHGIMLSHSQRAQAHRHQMRLDRAGHQYARKQKQPSPANLASPQVCQGGHGHYKSVGISWQWPRMQGFGRTHSAAQRGNCP